MATSLIQVLFNEVEDRARLAMRERTRCERDRVTYRVLLLVALSSRNQGVRETAIEAVSLHGIGKTAWAEVRKTYSVAELAAGARGIDLEKPDQ